MILFYLLIIYLSVCLSNCQLTNDLSNEPTVELISELTSEPTIYPTIEPSVNIYSTNYLINESINYPTIEPTIEPTNESSNNLPKPKPKPLPIDLPTYPPNYLPIGSPSDLKSADAIINSKLIASDGFDYQRFGHQVVVDPVSGVAVVSTNYLSKQTGGTIYTYLPAVTNNGKINYIEFNKILVPISSRVSQSDIYLAIYDGLLLVGVPLDNTISLASGVVYTYLIAQPTTRPTNYPTNSPTNDLSDELTNYPTISPTNTPSISLNNYIPIYQTIYSSNNQIHEKFGSCLSIYQSIVVIGASGHDIIGIENGIIYIYTISDNILVYHSTISAVVSSFANFGSSIYLTENWLIVGAPSDSTNEILSGSVTIYSITKSTNYTINYATTLLPTYTSTYSYYGRSIYLSNDLLVISASQLDGSGLVYVYRYIDSYWIETNRLVSETSSYYDRFADSLVVSKIGSYEVIAVGCPGDDSDEFDIGSVQLFVYKNLKWDYIGKITSNSSKEFTNYASTLSTYLSTYLFIGADLSPGVSDKSGAVYLSNLSTYLSAYLLVDSTNDLPGYLTNYLSNNLAHAVIALMFALLPVVLLSAFISYRIVRLQRARFAASKSDGKSVSKIDNKLDSKVDIKKTKKLRGQRTNQPFSLMLNDDNDFNINESIDRSIDTELVGQTIRQLDRQMYSQVDNELDSSVDRDLDIGIDSSEIYLTPNKHSQLYIDV
uniref:Uncharacterized protein n=1 Tax=Chromulina nebulosa TaxID=96789 RepID=A0A7S0SX24_9STRA|mmetsp:Transcript_3624/g.3224  ORF Transcript_3624/g.3224 Transcript_3624/m.3224 type:complete len:716 (+) Transcript_3624:44-2191(+)